MTHETDTQNRQVEARLERIYAAHPRIMEIEARAVRIQTTSMRFELKSQRLYALADEMKAMLEPFIVCAQGCSHCCFMPTMIYFHEAKRIAKASGRLMSSVPARPMHISLERAEAFNGKPCPFLLNDRCSIYEERPLICRLHNSLNDDPAACKIDDGGTHGSVFAVNPDWIEVPYIYSVQAWNPQEPYGAIQEFFPQDGPDQDHA